MINDDNNNSKNDNKKHLGKASALKNRKLSGIAQISEKKKPRPPIRATWSSFFQTSKRRFTRTTGKKYQ